jgi:enoyl-CoA hydratase
MEIERVDEIAVVRLRGGKGNAMTPELLQGLQRLIGEVEASDARAVVLTGHEGFFSAGLALPGLIDLDRPTMRGFMVGFEAAMMRVFRLGLPTVAAINGHAIAGGCVLALQCDLRLLAEGPAKIGLNEVRLGIGLPACVVEPLRLAVPPTSMPAIALEGTLFAAADALRVGLVHELVPAPGLIDRAVERARELARAPGPAYAQAKASIRRPAVEAIARTSAEEGERWLDTWYSTPAQALLRDAVARLKK